MEKQGVLERVSGDHHHALSLMSVLALVLLLAAPLAWSEEPPLPAGLGATSQKQESSEPALPLGLGTPSPKQSSEPTLPAGLGTEAKPTEPELPLGLAVEQPKADDRTIPSRRSFSLPDQFSGFWEVRGGIRTQKDPYEKQASMGETRLQLEWEERLQLGTLKLTTDFLYDPVASDHQIRLERGTGWLDIRNANFQTRPLDVLDVKMGRQILTWGTGDQLFINDLFPKDWNSFFIGRDDEYLKAPSDAIKTSVFSEWANLDIVYTPRFDADRSIDGRRISYWNTMLGRRAGRDAPVHLDKPDDWFDDDEIAFRLSRNLGGYELALYAYDGFWKSPAGMNPVTLEAICPKLSVYGASVRGTVGRGIGHMELGYYDSREDRSGDDPFVRNSEFRFLAGYEQEIARDLTAGFQYYLEWMMDYDQYLDSLPPGAKTADEDRHVVTLRLTKLLMNQNLSLSLFTFYSPSDNDVFFRPKVHYKVDDHWSVEAGANVFIGEEDHSFFGQFQRNSNVYAGARCSF